jgi:hypothetical protein
LVVVVDEVPQEYVVLQLEVAVSHHFAAPVVGFFKAARYALCAFRASDCVFAVLRAAGVASAAAEVGAFAPATPK